MRKRSSYNNNKFNIKFSDQYTQYGKRRRLSTMVRDDLLTDFEEISSITSQPMSKILDVLLIEMMQSEQSVKDFLEKVRKY